MAIYIDDRELVAAHRAGDGDAFGELVREHRQSLLSHAKNKLRCDAAAEDALQETLVRAYKALPRFDGEYRLGPWLHRIMHNVCIDEANRRRRDGEKTDVYASQLATRRDSPSVEDELGMHFDDSDLTAALDSLPPTHRQALELKFLEEYDYSEMAAISGVSEQNARARVSRARLAMRSALKGVAAFPVILFGLLRRGEKAAAAATSAGGAVATSTAATAVPALTEAGTAIAQIAPATVPLMTKAAVGIGLAAAVLTPTADSALHQAVEQITTGSVGVVAEQTVDAGSSLADAIAKSTAVASDPTAAMNSAAVTSLSGEELQVSELGAGRYAVTGLLAVSVNETEIRAELDQISWIRIDAEQSSDNRQRIDGLLEMRSSAGATGSIRLAGFAVETPEGLAVSGVYRYAGDLAEVSSEGAFEGMAMLNSGPAELTLQFAS